MDIEYNTSKEEKSAFCLDFTYIVQSRALATKRKSQCIVVAAVRVCCCVRVHIVTLGLFYRSGGFFVLALALGSRRRKKGD